MTSGSTRQLNRREQLLVHQIHAAQHALARHGHAPACSGGFPPLAAITHFPCPTCMTWVPVADWSEEHAPVQKGSATMGAATTSVITCAGCNNGPGRTYEKNADANKFHQALDVALPDMTCDLHGPAKVEHKASGLFVVRDELPFARTDFKAGYLLAFAALGYTWAAGPGLDARRAAIASAADGPPDRELGYLLRTELPGSAHHSDNLVINVAAPAPCVIVRAATGVSVVLPAPGQRAVPTSLGGVSPASSSRGRGRRSSRAATSTKPTSTGTCSTSTFATTKPISRRWRLRGGPMRPCGCRLVRVDDLDRVVSDRPAAPVGNPEASVSTSVIGDTPGHIDRRSRRL